MKTTSATNTEREEIFAELQTLRRLELVRILARKLRVKRATLKDKTKAELIWALVDGGLPSELGR